jgi:L-lactate dehydrogenase complex protein LldE
VWEFTELLATLPLGDVADECPATVAVHRSCHMERELGVREQPGEALARVSGLTSVPWDGDDRCCGFGGSFAVKLPEASVAMADEKLDSLPAGVDTIVGADSSCLLHLSMRADARGIPVAVRHVAEMLVAPPSEVDDG